MKRLLIILALAIPSALLAQDAWQSLLEAEMPADMKMSCALYHIAEYEKSASAADVSEKVSSKSLVTHPDGRIKIEIIHRKASEINSEFLGELELEITAQWRNRMSTFIHADQIFTLRDILPENYFIKSVMHEPNNDEGPDTMNVRSYIDAGKDGSGIKIAIIDNGYDELTDAVNQGDVPSNYTAYDHTGTGLEAGGNEHGTGCFEVAYDNAPGATYYIHKTFNGTEFGEAVDQAISDGVDIITTSLGPHNTGWDDNTGPYCTAVIDAVNDGMLFFVTAGNEARKHWQGDFFDTNNNDNWHDWDGTDEYNLFSTPGNSNASAWLQWDSDESVDHYDLYLYNSSGSTILDSSTGDGGFESVSTSNGSSSATSYNIRVLKKTANPPPFELFVSRNSCEHFISESSIESPANTTSSNCISVGAVTHNNYATAEGGTPITSYSSHGPTNNGNQAPDICAVTNSTTNAYEGAFSGTSCSAPNAAGAAAALWSSLPNYTATGIRQLLLRQAKLFRDWGAPGTDMIYGNGGLYLKDHTPNTVYIYEFSGNTTGTSTRPYSSIQQADQYAPSNYNAFFLAHDHAAPAGGTLVNKSMIYRSVAKTTTIR